jgi:hypothetical protein
MSKKILPLIAMALLSGPLAAHQTSSFGPDSPYGLGAPQVVPIAEFVGAIEQGAYGRSIDAEGDALLDFAAYLYITHPLASVAYSTNGTTIEQMLITDLLEFNNYWVLSGPSASLFSYGFGNADGPVITSSYIINNIDNAEYSQPIKAPEMSANGATGALTLLVGAVLVMRGRRPARQAA